MLIISPTTGDHALIRSLTPLHPEHSVVKEIPQVWLDLVFTALDSWRCKHKQTDNISLQYTSLTHDLRHLQIPLLKQNKNVTHTFSLSHRVCGLSHLKVHEIQRMDFSHTHTHTHGKHIVCVVECLFSLLIYSVPLLP